jgi:hypothetical protein
VRALTPDKTVNLAGGITARDMMGEQCSIEAVDAPLDRADLAVVKEWPHLRQFLGEANWIGIGIDVHRAPRNETARRPTFVAADGLFNSAEKKSLYQNSDDSPHSEQRLTGMNWAGIPCHTGE